MMKLNRKGSKRAARVRFDNDEMDREDGDIRPSHASVQRGLPNIGRRDIAGCDERQNDRRGSRAQVYRRRSGNMNDESHTPKYGRQDERHQLPRRCAKEERLDALWERQFRAEFGYPSNDECQDYMFAHQYLDHPYDGERHFVSVEEQEEWRRQDVMDEWRLRLEMEAEWDEFMAMCDEARETRMRARADEPTFPDWDLDYFDEHYNAYYGRLFENERDDLGDVPDMGIFDDFCGCDERELDRLSGGQASQLRFSDRRPTRRMLNDLASL